MFFTVKFWIFQTFCQSGMNEKNTHFNEKKKKLKKETKNHENHFRLFLILFFLNIYSSSNVQFSCARDPI